MTASFQLEGRQFMALNGGPRFKFTEAIWFFVSCETQQEVDSLLGQTIAGGGSKIPMRLGQGQVGLSWQMIPAALGRRLSDPDPKKAKCVMEAMLQMEKIDIRRLEEAYDRV